MIKYNNVFIDLDDTLWDFKSNSRVSLRQVYEEFSLSRYYPLFDEFYDTYTVRNGELWQLYHHGKISKTDLITERFRYPLQRVGIIDDRLSILLNHSYLDILSSQSILIKGAESQLQYLSAKYRLFVISNGFQEVQFKKMRASGISDYFQQVILSEDAGVTKPHPDIFTYALKQSGATCQNSIMIGDNYDADIVGAYESGIDQVFFNPDDKPKDSVIPTFEIKNWTEISTIL